MKRWFLYRVYKLNKGLFIFYIFFLSGTLFTNLLGWQATPFFVWGMYSQKEDTATAHPVIKVTINDGSVINYTRYTDASKFFLTSPLQLYTFIKKNGEDPAVHFLKRKLGVDYLSIQGVAGKVLNGAKEYDLFMPWYKRYLEQTTGVKINSLIIELLQAVYTAKNKIDVYSTESIGVWKQ